MEKFLKIVKINLLSIIAIPLLLLATVFKLTSKALEKIPVFLKITAVGLAVICFMDLSKSKENLLTVLLTLIAVAVVFSLIVFLFIWIFALISGVVAVIWYTIISIFDGLYSMTYSGYLQLYSSCENDYQILSINGAKAQNSFFCLFYSILKGISWIITTLISLALPLAIAASVGLVGFTLFDLNRNIRAAFGLSLFQFIGKCEPATLLSGAVVYLVLMALVIITMMAIAFEWYEWAQEIRMTDKEISSEISRIQKNELKMPIGDNKAEMDEVFTYKSKVDAHVKNLEDLNTRAQIVLNQKKNPILQSALAAYYRNLEYITDEFNKGITLEQFRKLIPSIQQLDKQQEEVEKMVEKTEKEMKNPAGSSIFFAGCDNLEKLEKRYKSLCKTYHPDIASGDTETFQKMQDEYAAIKAAYENGQKA